MEKELKQYTRRVRNLVFIFVITAILVSVSTYAWFIGMRTVTVEEFEIEIKAADSLALSLDGITFSESVSIDNTSFDVETYTNNTNWWTGPALDEQQQEIPGEFRGLIPMSSVGVVDTDSARLKLYEKASVTPSPGGFRLIATQVKNGVGEGLEDSEQPGYVAFDLFIRNSSGSDYIPELKQADEEAIYLTVDSAVGVGAGGVLGTGIENSVRVAFAQIGRVSARTDLTQAENQALVQGIECKDVQDTDDINIITSICSRTAQIWEPNDVSHVTGAINWYNLACRPRTALKDEGETKAYNTSGTCSQIIDGLAYPTYAIKDEIDADDAVDVYDGLEYNTFEATTLLENFTTFTDTDKFKEGMDRPTFMTLAANSITKVRVYVYIEGQDIDNYDFAQIGKAISVKFGFTKQRFTEDDTGYTGPNTNEGSGPEATDKNPPVIAIAGFETGEREITLTIGGTSDHIVDGKFVAPTATATDNVDEGAVTVTVTNKVNVGVAGTYTVVYRAEDAAKNVATKTLKVIVKAE